ncbi:hypothetical protein KCU71_g45, partial [Aureobasidium melanogenum]
MELAKFCKARQRRTGIGSHLVRRITKACYTAPGPDLDMINKEFFMTKTDGDTFYMHVAMTLGESIPVGFGISGNMRRFVDLVHLLEDEVVCPIVLADNGYSATLTKKRYRKDIDIHSQEL